MLTAGNRSITDPEPYGQEQETGSETDKNAGSILLYAGVGIVAAVAIGGAIYLLAGKKKKTGSTTKE